MFVCLQLSWSLNQIVEEQDGSHISQLYRVKAIYLAFTLYNCLYGMTNKM